MVPNSQLHDLRELSPRTLEDRLLGAVPHEGTSLKQALKGDFGRFRCLIYRIFGLAGQGKAIIVKGDWLKAMVD